MSCRILYLRLFLFCIVTLGVAAACADNTGQETERFLEAQVDEVVAKFVDPDGPGYAIGVIRGGEVVVAKGFGYADIAQRRRISPDTPLNLASLSKQFTAAAIALELSKGTFQLEDPLLLHWDGLPEFMEPVRIDHLIYMTSGLAEYYSLPSPRGGWTSESRFTVDDAIDAVLKSGSLEYSPGTRWSYSNINYQLLAQLIERVSGQSFAGYMDENVFQPLGMFETWVDAPVQSDRPNKATNYERADGGAWREAPRLSPHYGGSGVYASINDLTVWIDAVFRNDRLGPDFGALMLSTRRFDHDKTNDAFGLVHSNYRGTPTIWYAGSDYGVSTYMVVFPDYDAAVICLANFSDGRCQELSFLLSDVIVEFP